MILQSPCSQSSETRQLRKLARLEPKKNVCSEYVELFYRLHLFKVTGFKSLRETERPYSIYSPKLASLRFFPVSAFRRRRTWDHKSFIQGWEFPHLLISHWLIAHLLIAHCSFPHSAQIK